MNNLEQLRTAVDAKRRVFESARVEFRLAETADRNAAGAARDERIERSMEIGRGGPRPNPAWTPPKSVLALEADAAAASRSITEQRANSAASELRNAEAALLAAENRILSAWRDCKAREFKALERDGATPEALAALRAELKAVTPPDSAVRINQRFNISSLVREVLNEQPEGDLALHTPVNQLSGLGGGAEYERRRREILDAAEAESTTPQAAA